MTDLQLRQMYWQAKGMNKTQVKRFIQQYPESVSYLESQFIFNYRLHELFTRIKNAYFRILERLINVDNK